MADGAKQPIYRKFKSDFLSQIGGLGISKLIYITCRIVTTSNKYQYQVTNDRFLVNVC